MRAGGTFLPDRVKGSARVIPGTPSLPHSGQSGPAVAREEG